MSQLKKAQYVTDWLKWKKSAEQRTMTLHIVTNQLVLVASGNTLYISFDMQFKLSNGGYGQKGRYLGMVNENRNVHCCLLFGKFRVPPVQFVSITRLELTATPLSVKISNMLKKELAFIMIMMMMMNCFWGIFDQRKAFSLISNQEHCQRSSPTRIFDASQVRVEPVHNLKSGLIEWSCSSDNHYTMAP